MRLVVLLLAATAALAAQGAQAAACSNYTDCEACRADSNCAWTTHKDCSVSCVAIASFPADPLSTPWRTRISIAVNTTCASAETCASFFVFLLFSPLNHRLLLLLLFFFFVLTAFKQANG